MNKLSSKNQRERPTLAQLSVDPEGLRQLLGLSSISKNTIWRLERRNLIKRVPGIRRRLFTMESVRNFIAGKAGGVAGK